MARECSCGSTASVLEPTHLSDVRAVICRECGRILEQSEQSNLTEFGV